MEIGETLRDARVRARLDISDIEHATKIRAKYLRALENQEWGMLPGPTYVKSFIKSYADYLGLDSKRLVEEYRLRFEGYGRPENARASTSALTSERRQTRSQANARSQRHRGRQVPERGRSRGAIIGVVVAVLLVGLFVVGLLTGGDDNPPPTPTSVGSSSSKSESKQKTEKRTTTTAKPAKGTSVVKLSVRPTGEVWVCLVDASKKRLINGQTLDTASTARTYKSKKFLVTLGNGDVTLLINGKRMAIPNRSKPVGYEITSGKAIELAESQQPTCS